MSLPVGTVMLYTDLAFSYPKASFVMVNYSFALVIEGSAGELRPVGSLTRVDWDIDEWKDYGWEVILPHD